MPAYLSDMIMWTCGIAFLVCMVAGLLIVTGIWEPKDSAVRKWLLRVVVFSVVGAVAGFAVRQFSAGAGNDPQRQMNESEEAGREDPARQRDQTGGTQHQNALPPVEPNPEAIAPVRPPVPNEVVEWASDALGTRPMFNVPANYPGCVQTLRNQEVVSRKEARSCRAELERLHLTAIVEFYDLKRAYDDRLEQHEAALRERGISQEELPRYNYVVSEMERLNGDGSSEIRALHRLEGKLLQDIQTCRQSLCQPIG